MPTENKVLACVDQSHFADTVADAAIWAAAQMAAPLEFLHVIDRHQEIGSGDDHSGAIGINAQEHLLTELSARDATSSRQAREKGRLFLNRLRERAIAAGITAPDMRQRYGHLEESLVEQEADVGLYVLGRRGEAAENSLHDSSHQLGGHVERVIRALKKPILTVTENFQPPQRFMIAFDGGAVTRRGVEMLAASPLLKGIPCHILMSGKSTADAAKQLEWAKASLGADFAVTTQLVSGDAEPEIAKAVAEQAIDLLVMGAYAHSPIRSLLFGSRTKDLLRSVRLPSLLLR